MQLHKQKVGRRIHGIKKLIPLVLLQRFACYWSANFKSVEESFNPLMGLTKYQILLLLSKPSQDKQTFLLLTVTNLIPSKQTELPTHVSTLFYPKSPQSEIRLQLNIWPYLTQLHRQLNRSVARPIQHQLGCRLDYRYKVDVNGGIVDVKEARAIVRALVNEAEKS